MQPYIPTAGKSDKIPYGQLKKYFADGKSTPNPGNGKDSVVTGKYENLQFFYHPDHLGSSNYITDASGEVYQHNEYFPYGETFVEERNAAEYTNYLFSGKELDVETGLYYFGARYHDPRTSVFLNIDPKVDKYPGISPYAYCMGTPINAFDPNGKDVVFMIDKEGAGGKGHMAMLFQNSNGGWYFFSQGATERGSNLSMVSNSAYNGRVLIAPMNTTDSNGDVVPMTKQQAFDFVKNGFLDGNVYDEKITLKTSKEQDDKIFDNAFKLKEAYSKGDEKYRVITNNCVDAVQDVVLGDKGQKTGISLPNDGTPVPNNYYKKLETSIPVMNGDMYIVTPKSGIDGYYMKPIVTKIIE